jgi:Tol biopolymer transport system component
VANSRDALVVLSAGVGLSVPGSFDLTTADVDRDQQVSSRDALFILSAGIGIGMPPGVYAGLGVPARCAPAAPAPADLVFFSDNGIETVMSGQTSRTVVNVGIPVYTGSPVRWSPDGTKLLFECDGGVTYYQDLCTANADGSGLTILNVGVSVEDRYPDWSPDGTQIAFIRNYNIYAVPAGGGAGNVRAVVTGYRVYELAWSPDGTRIAFTGDVSCCSRRLFVANADGSGVTQIVSTTYTPEYPNWSLAGDSILYYTAYYSRSYEVAASGSGTPGTPVTPFNGTQYWPDWAAAGVGFVSNFPGSSRSIYYHRVSDGRVLRVTRGSGYNGDYWPDFRRAAGVYVSSIAVTPNPATITLSVSTTQQLTATVLNSDASLNTTAPVTWISRGTGFVTVSGTGLATGVSTGSAYIVAKVGGWRSDSTLVTVQP